MPALRWIASTLLTLVLVSGLTFPLLELHSDPAARSLDQMRGSVEQMQAAERVILERTGRIDPETGEERSLQARYLAWLSRLVRLDLAPEGVSAPEFRRRLLRALGTSAGIGLAAFLLALGIGAPLGVWLGLRRGRPIERVVSGLLLLLSATPVFVLATVLLLALGIGLDLDLPVLFAVVSLGAAPLAVNARLVRAAVRALEDAPFVRHLRHQGASEREIARSLALHATGPVRAQSALWLPGLITGSLLVETVFELPGLGRMFFDALDRQDVPTVLMLATLSALIVSVAWSATEWWQERRDPRFRAGGTLR